MVLVTHFSYLPLSAKFVRLVVGVSISLLSFDLCVTMGFSKVDIECGIKGDSNNVDKDGKKAEEKY